MPNIGGSSRILVGTTNVDSREKHSAAVLCVLTAHLVSRNGKKALVSVR